MKKRFLALLCVLAMLVSSFAACTPAEVECEHPLSETWANDAKNHWKPTTCEHSEFRSTPEAHVDADEDGKCDVCTYEVGHTHTYASEWSADGKNHWKAATCTHTNEKSELSLHLDDNTDGVCDVCANHAHVVDSSGFCIYCDEKVIDIEKPDTDESEESTDGDESDESEAPEESTDEGGVNVNPPASDESEESTDGSDENDDPAPKPETDADTIKTILAAIMDRSPKKVLNGKVDYGVVIRSADGNIEEGDTVEYVLHTDGTYTKRTETNREGATVITEVWMELLDAENELVNAILVETIGGKVTNAEPAALGVDDLAGYYFAVSTLAGEYGAEAVLQALYEHSQSETAKNFTVTRDKENRTFNFSFDILIINTDTAEGEDDGVDYYEVEVTFGYSEDYILTALNIVCDCYTNSLEDEAEHDYVYDQTAKTITMKDSARADTYTFSVTQASGTREAIVMEDAEQYVPTDVTIYEDATHTKEAISVTVKLGTDAESIPEFYVGCPAGTFISFVKSAARISVDRAGLTASLVGENIQFYPALAGTYVITLTFGNVSKSVTVVVEAAETVGASSFEVTLTETYAWVDLYTFTAAESGSYTFYLPYGVGAWDQKSCDDFSGQPYVDFQDMWYEGSGFFTVDIAADDTYSFYISGMSKGPYTIGYDFEAKEVVKDEGEDEGEITWPLTIGRNQIEQEDKSYSYYAISEGTLTLNLGAVIGGSVEVTYSVNGGELRTLAVNSSAELALNAGDKVLVNVVATGYSTLSADWSGYVESTMLGLGENVVVITEAEAEEGGQSIYLLTDGAGIYTFANDSLAVRVFNSEDELIGTGIVELADDTYYRVFVACTIPGTYVINVTVAGDGEGGASGKGTEDDPYVIEIPAEGLETEGNSTSKLWYLFSTTEAGTLTLTYSNGNSWVEIWNVDDAQDSNQGYNKTSYTFELQANSTYRLGLGVWVEEEGVTATLTFVPTTEG